ncbi:MAG TPA: hypothetical protein VGO56_11780 [Pyrinomonadaceae bacterium]|jgi:hypothetical protein|nr:hypothetical protein [Pyrinomonadaceae bacterium]
MDKYRLRNDLSFWNLDGLEFWEEPTARGTINVTTIQDDLSGLKRMVLFGKTGKAGTLVLLCLRPKARLMQRVDIKPGSTTVTPHHTWTPDTDIIDIAVEHDMLFALIQRDVKHHVKMYRVSPDRLLSQRDWEWSIDPYQLTTSSRIQIATRDGSKRAYIGPCRGEHFLSVDLKSGMVSLLEIHFPSGEREFGADLDFCVDAYKNSLVIADTNHHRIVEVNCVTGSLEVICGVGRPGNAREEELARTALLHSPRSVAVYRPAALIRDHLLDAQSRSFLESDPEGTRPRTLLFADSGNSRVKKIVDLPFLACEVLSSPDGPFIYSMIGSGQEVHGKPHKVNKNHGQDLRLYPIPKPSDLLIGGDGDCLIYSRSSQTTILLRPSTALSQDLNQGKPRGADTTDA